MLKGSFFILFCLTLALSVCACGSKRQPDAVNPLDLAQSDVTALNTADYSGAQAIDERYNGAFSAVFGGASAAAVMQYFQTRVHHIVDPNHVGISPAQFANTGWRTDAKPAAAGPNGANAAQTGEFSGASGLLTAALNVGVEFWLDGLINQVPVTLLLEDGTTVPIDSSRAGIVILGEAYMPSIKNDKNQEVALPAEFRQSILLHEARHSDCTGGITEAQLVTLRGLKSSTEYEQAFKSMPCGHLHRICQTGEFVGAAVCDNEPWGAYTVGSVYALAALHTARADQDTHYQRIMAALVADQSSRDDAAFDDLLEGRYGKPDMSHQGYTR